MSYLDFQSKRDCESDSWRRADPDSAMIERTSPVDYVVTLPGGKAHSVVYGKERGAYVGWCDCHGFEFHEGPCAHLCTLRKAEFVGDTDIQERPIEAGDTASLVEADARETTPDLIADGGKNTETVENPVAGADGRVFGRPEAQL